MLASLGSCYRVCHRQQLRTLLPCVPKYAPCALLARNLASSRSVTPRGSLHPSPFHPNSLFCTMAPLAQNHYRLPVNVQPTHYDLTVWTDLKTSKFGGFVNISLDVHEETSAVVLNTHGLDLGNASIISDVQQTEQVQSGQTIDINLQRVTFTFPSPLAARSKAQLKIPFDGHLSPSMTGYYVSAWEDNGQTKHYALTQFEPTDARSAFPCLDEPLFKATFAITMVSHADTVNISNMPSISEEIYDGRSNGTPDINKLLLTLPSEHKWKITRFQTTPKMSSYIVAWANGPFVHLEQKVTLPLSGKTVPLRIYSTPDVIHQAAFALDVVARVLPIYETVFDVEFPLPKLDTLVVIVFFVSVYLNSPSFTSGAMENWGLITGRTSALLLDPAKSDINAKKNVAMTQSHEVAHMWFGNITTMRWWDNLYLNEGLRFFLIMGEVIILGEIFPEWKANSGFITDHLQSALALDAKLSSHPIEVECPDANHINQIFDALSYSKGASVLRMLCDYVGEEKFLKGVSLYLKKNLYGNTVTNDLFEGISAATGFDTVRVMDNWIKKQGFPVITVTESENGIHVRQDRFIETGHVDPKENETIWNVPLSILTADQNGQVSIDKSAILEEREKDITLDTNRAFKLNAGSVGVYRTLYTPDRLAKIAVEAAKENSVFTLDDRMGILYDSLALSKAGLAELSDTLTVIDLWANEKEYLVWSSVSEALGTLINTFWESPQTVEILRAFIRSLFVPLVERLGYEYSANEPPDVALLRTLAISTASAGKHPGVIDELKSRFTHFMETGDDSKIPADLQSCIFTTAVRYGGPAEYNAVVGIQEKPKTPTAHIAAMYAMGRTEDPALLDQTFSYILTKSRDQDVVYFFRGLQSNPHARRKFAEFFKDNYDYASVTFFQKFCRAYNLSFGTLSTAKDYERTELFFKDKDTSKYHMTLAQALETIRTRTAYIERSLDDLNKWLKAWEKRAK
ncbi:leucyl aminopeptidase [Mycena pura]|uniref:Aminopeptidase n=1 Tax=Mycena pura TaxID=153505 RepID=A0AAD6VST1_9AGAR|nr:leucyl aminopeptidase [Mycena pura]